jgi:hypothetical protein
LNATRQIGATLAILVNGKGAASFSLSEENYEAVRQVNAKESIRDESYYVSIALQDTAWRHRITPFVSSHF